MRARTSACVCVHFCLKVLNSSKALHNSRKTSKAPTQPGRGPQGPCIHRKKSPVQTSNDGEKKEVKDEETSPEGRPDAAAEPGLHIPPQHDSSAEGSDCTDNSSGKAVRRKLCKYSVNCMFPSSSKSM